MSNIKVAIIGMGRWGVHLLRNFLAHHQAEVVAIVDPQPERLTVIKQQFQLDELNPQILLGTAWEEIIKIRDLQAIVIATPATTHYQLIKNALLQGYHVLAEKPLTTNPEECGELCHVAEDKQLILMVDHTYLFHPAVEKGQTVVQNGTLGELRYGYASRTHLSPVRQDVDALWDLAIHDITIFNNWLGTIPLQVEAKGKVWLQKDISLADLVWVKLTYPDNFEVNIHLSWLNHDKQRKLGIVGSKGTLIFDEMSTNVLTLIHGELQEKESLFIPINQEQEILEIAKVEPLKKVCDRFIDCIITNTPPLISSGWVGRELVEILTALTTSLHENGQPVKIK